MQGTTYETKFGLEFELALYGRNFWLLHGSKYEKVWLGI